MENDANLAAVSEHRSRGEDRFDNLVYLLADHALGLGLIVGKTLHRGRGGRAGEIANQPSSPFADVSRWLSKHKDVDVVGELRTAQGDDVGAQQSTADLIEPLAAGLATLVYTLDPDLMVIGGGLAEAGDAVLEPTRARLARLCRGRDVPLVEASTLGEWAVPSGSLDLALDHAHHRMFAL